MFGTFTLLLAFAGLSFVSAQVGIYECDSATEPNYTVCDRIMANIHWTTGDAGLIVPDGKRHSWADLDNENCKIYACNVRGDGADQPMNTFNGPTFYGLIKQWCEPDLAGGLSPSNSPTYIRTANNRLNVPPTSRAKRAAVGKLFMQQLTIEEANREIELANSADSARLNKRISSRCLAEWTNFGTSKGIRNINVRDLMVRGRSGTTETWTTTNEFSSSVTTSAEMGVNFEIFAASISLSVTQETSYSYSTSMTFDASTECALGQRAVVYFYPLFDKYMGKFSDSDTVYNIWIPLEGQYERDTECLG